MAGFLCEYKKENLDLALYYYKKAEEFLKNRHKKIDDPVLAAAIKRTAPSEDAGTHAYNKAYEKYRSRNYKEAIRLYEEFINNYLSGDLENNLADVINGLDLEKVDQILMVSFISNNSGDVNRPTL